MQRRLVAVEERLAAIARSAAAASAELRAALQDEAGGTLAGAAAKEGDNCKTEETAGQATTPAPGQRDEGFALETPSAIHQERHQEIETIVKNQEAMRLLMAELVKSMGTVERRICNIEQEMGLITRFAQELNELGEDNWT